MAAVGRRDAAIEFFANPVPTPGGDPSGYGEGAIYLGSVRPNPQGKFTATLPPVPLGPLISTAATDAQGNTSEFCQNIAAVRRPWLKGGQLGLDASAHAGGNGR